MTATLPDASPNGGVQFVLDGHSPVGFDGTAPFEVTVSGLSEGPHAVYAQMCNTSGTVCQGREGAWASFTVQELHPSISSVAPMGMSPNGDGRSDATKVTYSLSNSQAVSYSILRWPSRALVRGPVSLGIQSAGMHSFVWNGTDPSTHRVSDGVYIIELNTYRHLAGSELATGVASDYVVVDDTATVLSKLTGSGATFAPKPDGYLDLFTPRITVNEAAAVFLDITNPHGALLRRLSVYHGSPGYVPVIWNGRAANGKIVSPGNYSFRFWAQDVAGNRSFTPYSPVHVSGK